MPRRFETELAMRQSVEGDIAGLRTLKKEYDSTNTILLQEATGLEKERAALRDAHQKVPFSQTWTLLSLEQHKNINLYDKLLYV